MQEETGGAVGTGRRTIRAVVASAAAGIIVGWLLSFIYSPVCYWNPIVYINLLITLILGYLVGSACRGVIRRRRIDNAALATVAGAAAGIVTWWLCWITYVCAVVRFDAGLYWMLLSTPSEMSEIFHLFSHRPVWSISKTAPGQWFYYAVWTAEFLAIVGQSAFVPRNFVKEHRLCDICRDWLVPTGDVGLFDIAGEDSSILDAVARGDLESLSRLAGLPSGSQPQTDSWLAANLLACPNCEGAERYVSVLHFSMKPAKKKDEMEKTVNTILRHHPVSEELENRLFAALAESDDGIGNR